MAISELQKMKDELSRIRGGGVEHSPSNVMQTDLRKDEKAKNGGGDPLKGALYIGEQLGLGTLRSIEGISDFLVGGVADLFGADEFAEKMMLNDWVDYNHANEWYQPGEGMQFIGDVAQGVGGMLPAVAITLATAGAAAPVALAGQIGSTAAFMLGAAGQSTSEAVKESNNLSGKEWLYGTASGVAEGAIEAVSGGLGGMKAGKVLGKQLGKNAIGKAAISFIGEGAEEVAADLLDPALKKVTGLADTYEAPTAQELGRTFAVGGATGLAMGGLNTGIRTIAEGGVKKRKAVDAASELQEQQAEENVRQAEGEETLYTEEDIKASQERLSKPLQKMSKENREKFFEKHSTISNMFNEDGTVKDNSAPESYNTDAYSASLKGQEGTLAYKPVAKTSKVSDIAKQAMNTLAKMTRGKSNIVLTEDTLTAEDGSNANGLYRDGVIYLNANATSYDKALAVGVHEVVHGLEGTKEYGKLSKYIIDAIDGDPELFKKYDINKYRAAYDKLLQGEWSEGTKDYQASTEIFANFLADKVVGNEKLLNKLANRDKNIIQKFIDWVRDSIAKFGESAEDKAARKDLKKLEGLFVNALNAGAGGIALEDVEKSIRAAEKAKLAKEAQKRNAETTEEKKNTVGKGKLATARFSTDLTFAEQVDAVLAGTDVQSSHLQVRANTPKILLDVGLSDKPMLITSVHTKTAVGKEVKNKNIHNIDVGVFKDLPKLLENPAIIMDSTKQNSIVVFVDAVDNAKNPIMCAINIQGEGYYNSVKIDTNLIASAYGKDNNPIGFIKRAVDENRVLYWDKKMSQALFEIPGLQLPDNLNRLSSNVIIRKTNVLVNTFDENSSKKVEKNSKGRASLDVDFANQAKKYYGSTYRWSETGYLLQDGTRLDLSGRNEGASGGYRTVDHRDIFDINEDLDVYGTDAMNEFIAQGNIRVMPETPGINLQVEPNAEQYRLIQDFVERVGWKEGYFSVDIDNKNGDTIETLIYEGKPSGRKVVADLKYYFKEGKVPYKSNLSAFRYSINVDSLGNQLTKEQQEYFKDSKVRDEDGNLLVVYHGTRKADFTEFKRNINFYTDSEEMADSYAPSSEKYVGYLNIENPFVIDANGERWSRIPIDAKTKAFLEKYGASTFKEGGKWRTSPADIASAIEAGIDEGELGYDGIIIKNVDDTGRYWKTRGNIVANDYITFKSNQFKNASNKNPTKNADIRYSLNLAETYTSKQVANVIDDVVDMLVEIGEIDLNQYDVQVYGKDTLARKIADRLNAKATTSTKTAAQRAEGFIDEILDKVRIAKTDDAVLIDAEQTLNFLRKYYHSMDLRSVKSDINNERYYNLFSGGEKAMAWDSVLQEIVELHPEFEMDTDIETLLNVMDAYENARNTIRENKVPLSKIVLDLGFVKQMMKEQLKNSLEGNATTYKKVKKQSFAKELEVKKGSGAIDAELDKKTTERVQTVVDDRKWHERWGDAYESLKNKIPDQWIKAQIAWTDEQAGILQAGKNVGVVLHGEVQRARTAKASAINMLNNEQRDYSGKKRVGDSLKDIFKPIQSRGKKVAQNFNLYLLHQLNVDRMSAVETADRQIKVLFKANPMLEDAVNGQYEDAEQWRRAVRKESGGKEYLELLDVENKPVFEENVDKAFSLEKIKELEKQYPEFKETAEKVWKYNQNLLQYRVDAGLITQEQADKMTEMYPHYVPAFYESKGSGTSGASVGNKGIAVKTGIKKAKGSKGLSDILDVQASIAKQTVAVVRAASINKVIEKLYDGAVAKKDFTDIAVVSKERIDNAEVDYDKEVPKKNQLFFYKDGERITLDTTEYVDAGFRGLTAGAQIDDPLTKLSEKAIDVFKKSVTSWNLLFAVTNTIRDAQEALFYTKYRKKSFVNYWKALFARRSSPKMKELWEQYKALGGTGSGYFNIDTGVYDDRGKVRRGVDWLGDKIQIVNEWVEQAPRFAEFVASVESGNSLEQALYDSAEVTTNFSRGGKITKKLNRCLIPFLNPSVQGWSKLWRSWVAPMDGKSAAEIERLSKESKFRKFWSNYGMLVVKSILCGVTVGLLNDMLYSWFDDDEDYDNLPMNIKENYYLIKIDGKFIKIPKGRVLALYGSVLTRYVEYSEGDEDAFNAWDWFKSASEMVSPLESASRTIIAPFYDVWTNTTWYGGQIENASMENLAPSDRYDESTSSLAIAIGKSINYSPKKVHYLIDQYTGVIGDLVLPFTTNKAEKDPASARFIVDPVYNSDVANQYYDLKQELTFAKNSGDSNAKMMLKYINEAQGVVAEMYQQKRDIANDKNLKDKEKRDQTEVIQSLINATLSASIERADEFEQLLINSGFENAAAALIKSNSYQKMSETGRASAYNKLIDYYYAVVSSRLNNTMVDTKYVLYGAINATDVVVYLTDINNIESDTDKKGNVIQGSRKEKVQKYIQGLKLTAQQKYILSYLAGYAPTDNGKSAISKYLKKNGYTQKEVNNLWI